MSENPSPHCTPLTTLERPLLNKFYKTHGSAMRTGDAGEAWVVRAGEIVAGLNLTPVADGQWLTGLLVAPDRRRQGLARLLIEAACGDRRTWLFCHPDLQGFYEGLGFTVNEELPQGSRCCPNVEWEGDFICIKVAKAE